jgi:hypothetical protein
MTRANQSTLIATAQRKGEATASSWRAYYRPRTGRLPAYVEVWHYAHPMFRVETVQRTVEPVSRGYGSMTDKCGVRKILAGYGIHMGYNELYESLSRDAA